MVADKKPDFSGYATRNGLKCSDGRVIMGGAFKHMDGQKVPLVWQHQHGAVDSILGHALLENREDGVYTYGFFNDTQSGTDAKRLVRHGDITAMSIYANQLVQQGPNVTHGNIREVSLVLSGANPGAFIDNVNLQHSDGAEETSEAIIYTGLELFHGEDAEEFEDDELDETEEVDETDDSEDSETTDNLEHAGDDMADKTVKEVVESMTDEQQQAMHYLIGEALKSTSAEHSDDEGEDMADEAPAADEQQDNLTHSVTEGDTMTRNVFDQTSDKAGDKTHTLSHSDVQSILTTARSLGSVKDAVEDYALKHGINDIELLFPDAKNVTTTPEFFKRRTEWVAKVLGSTRHTPFSRIKSMTADLTPDEARAKGYIKGNFKKEEFFRVSKRVTTPQTIYKKQKLDRDDIVDITDFDVVVWLKGEMRLMLEEEIARAILIGDGRSVGDEDKISEDHVRSIANDDPFYQTTISINIDDDNSNADEIVDAITLNRRFYRGSGTPTFFTTEEMLAKLLLAKDTLGRRLYTSVADLASTLRVESIVPVEAMESIDDLIGIIVNLQDYNIGADKGGETSLFDDFDIDYNQYKYLIETRLSGALVKPKSALVIRKTAGTAQLATPTAPTEDTANQVSIPTDAKAVYRNAADGSTLAQGSTVQLTQSAPVLQVVAVPASGYYFATSAEAEWSFEYSA